MNEWTRLFAGLLLTVGAFVMWIQVMMHGWGVEPQSWWWIIGGSLLVGILTAVAQRLAK